MCQAQIKSEARNNKKNPAHRRPNQITECFMTIVRIDKESFLGM